MYTRGSGKGTSKDQSNLITRLNVLLTEMGRDKRLNPEGMCSGLSFIYMYSKWLSNQPSKRKLLGKRKPRDDNKWFNKMISLTLQNKRFEEYSAKEQSEIERFVSLLFFHQDPDNYIVQSSSIDSRPTFQTSYDEFFSDTSDNQVNIDRCFNISSTIEDLGEYLRLMPDDSYITLEAYKHATTLIKKNGTYIFYDPNEPRGELTFESPKELSRTIFKFYDRVKKEGTKTSKIQLEINFLSFNRPDARMQKYAGKKKQFRIDSEKYFSKYAAFEKRFIADFSAHEKRYAGKARRGSVVSPVRRDDASRGDVAKYVINLRTIEHIKMSVRDKHFTLPIDERDDAHSYSVKHHELISQMIQDNDFDAINN